MWHTGECIKIKISYNSSPVARSVAKVKTINTCTRTCTPTHTQAKKNWCPLLRFGLRAKSETKSIALHWVIKLWPRHASICGKHGDCSPTLHSSAFIYRWYYWAGMWPLIQFLSRNEHPSEKRERVLFFFFFWPPKPDKWAHDCLHGKDWFNTI